MKIGITGASGFVGTNLKLYFSKVNNIHIHEIDRTALRDAPLIAIYNLTAIIHLAGKAHDLKKVTNPNEYYEANFELTKKLFDSFLVSDTQKFIFISSIKAVADEATGVLDEEFLPAPETHYGRSKLMAEQYIQSQKLPADKSYFILRPCMIHGPGNKGNLNLLYKFIKRGIPYPFAGFNNKRSFLSIENLCFIINELIAKNNIESGIYNVADDEPLSTNEVVSIISSSLSKKNRHLKIMPWVIINLAKIGNWLHLPLTTERLNKLTGDFIVSNKKIKKAIDKELPLTSTQGLKLTVDSFKKWEV
jgi:nucleoside-diphosphate-sugar epimerase